MARQPIQISVASDTRQFSKGIKDGVIEPLEDVEDALADVAKESGDTTRDIASDTRNMGRDFDDLGRDGEKALEEITDATRDVQDGLADIADESKDAARDLERSMRDAQDDTADLERAHKDLHDVIEKGSRTSYRKVSDESQRNMRSASDDVDEFKDEAKQNFSEMASSFSGDMDSAVDLVQGTLGGLASSIPGYGLALGALGAAGGLFYNQWKESTEKAKQRVADMYDDMIESGESYLSESYVQENYWNILKDESEILSLRKTKEYAEAAGVSYTDVALAWAGNHEAMERVQQGLYDEKERLVEESKGWTADEAEALGTVIGGYTNIIGKSESRRAEIDLTIESVAKERTAWELMGTTSTEALQTTSEEVGRAQEKLRGYHTTLDNTPATLTTKLKVDLDEGDVKRRLDRLTARRMISVTPNYVEKSAPRPGKRIW